jgi:hypothetical protein
MISSSWLFGKWRISPAATKIISNGALMVLPEAFQLCLIGPYDPAVQGLIELTRPHQPPTDPEVETAVRDSQCVNQLRRPPFVG